MVVLWHARPAKQERSGRAALETLRKPIYSPIEPRLTIPCYPCLPPPHLNALQPVLANLPKLRYTPYFSKKL